MTLPKACYYFFSSVNGNWQRLDKKQNGEGSKRKIKVLHLALKYSPEYRESGEKAKVPK